MYIRFDSTGDSYIDYDDSNLISTAEYHRIIEEGESIDSWGDVVCVDDRLGIGVEYNFCIDNSTDEAINQSAFYAMNYNPETDYWETDTSDFVHYEIDFDDPDYRRKIKSFAIKLLTQRKLKLIRE